MLAPLRDLLARDVERRRIVVGLDQLAEFRRAGDVGPLADDDEIRAAWSSCLPTHARTARAPTAAAVARCAASGRGLILGDGLGDGADVVRRRAAAAADDVDEPAVGQFAEQPGHVFGALVVFAEGVGQAGIRIGADQRVGDARPSRRRRAASARRRARNSARPRTASRGAPSSRTLPPSGPKACAPTDR